MSRTFRVVFSRHQGVIAVFVGHRRARCGAGVGFGVEQARSAGAWCGADAQRGPVYAAVDAQAAEAALDAFEAGIGARYPAVVNLWRRSWEQFIPFLDYPPDVRRVIYTTNMIENINRQLRKATKTRGHFPNERSALKLLYLAIRNITTTRRGPQGTGTTGWKRCLNQLAIRYPERLPLT